MPQQRTDISHEAVVTVPRFVCAVNSFLSLRFARAKHLHLCTISTRLAC